MEAGRCFQRMIHLILKEVSKMNWMSNLNESYFPIDSKWTVETNLQLDASHVYVAEDTSDPKQLCCLT